MHPDEVHERVVFTGLVVCLRLFGRVRRRPVPAIRRRQRDFRLVLANDAAHFSKAAWIGPLRDVAWKVVLSKHQDISLAGERFEAMR